MAYQEKDFQTEFNKWWRHNKIHPNAAFELKISHNNRALAFNALAPHQKQSLLTAKHRGVIFKIPDLGNQNPFDCFSIKGSAFVVVKYHARGKREFVMIDIDVWCKEEEQLQRKSLTESRAKEIGEVYELGKIYE